MLEKGQLIKSIPKRPDYKKERDIDEEELEDMEEYPQ